MDEIEEYEVGNKCGPEDWSPELIIAAVKYLSSLGRLEFWGLPEYEELGNWYEIAKFDRLTFYMYSNRDNFEVSFRSQQEMEAVKFMLLKDPVLKDAQIQFLMEDSK